MELPPSIEGDEEVEYVLLEFRGRPVPDLAPGSQLQLKDIDTEHPSIEVAGVKYNASYEDTIGSLLLCRIKPEQAADQTAAREGAESDDAALEAGARARDEAAPAESSLAVCEKRLVVQVQKPSTAAAVAAAGDTAAAAAGTDTAADAMEG